jgi:hypothetical protein
MANCRYLSQVSLTNRHKIKTITTTTIMVTGITMGIKEVITITKEGITKTTRVGIIIRGIMGRVWHPSRM